MFQRRIPELIMAERERTAALLRLSAVGKGEWQRIRSARQRGRALSSLQAKSCLCNFLLDVCILSDIVD